jgi:uncharacterized protein (DUF1810 family)
MDEPNDPHDPRDPHDSYDLSRFVTAQNAGGTYDRAIAELRRGQKTSHWMWFVFPQIAGLGLSATSRTYAIASLDEAKAYLRHPVLGRRMLECVGILNALATPAASAESVFGAVDAQKLRSSLTLFLRAAQPEEQPEVRRALERFFGGVADAATDARL